MASPKIFFNKSAVKKNGEAAVYIIVHIGSKSLKLNTGVLCNPEKWNDETARVKGGSAKAKDDNLIIERNLALINDIMVRYRLTNEWRATCNIMFYKWFIFYRCRKALESVGKY